MKNTLKAHSRLDNVDIDAFLKLEENKILITFLIKGSPDTYVFPQTLEGQRANELWKATCFELFLANSQKEAYYELNFSSSLSWNFYYLKSYRAEVEEVHLLNEPKINVQKNSNGFTISCELECKTLSCNDFDVYNVASILLTQEQERTFWTIEHQKDVPDFHDRASFREIK